MLVSSAASLLQFAATHGAADLQVSNRVYLLALFMAVFSTVLPALLLSMGIARLGSSRAALVGSIGPVATIALAYFFLGEIMGAEQMLGSSLVLAGVLIVSLGKK
jgi:drug/metabolite transporter (DMT)-like permease